MSDEPVGLALGLEISKRNSRIDALFREFDIYHLQWSIEAISMTSAMIEAGHGTPALHAQTLRYIENNIQTVLDRMERKES